MERRMERRKERRKKGRREGRKERKGAKLKHEKIIERDKKEIKTKLRGKDKP